MPYELARYSPWGEVQQSKQICHGVFEVSTAGHGGIMVDLDVANVILSKAAQKEGFVEGRFLCFEEDCDAAVVIRELLDRGLMQAPVNSYFKEGEYSEVINKSLQTWHPEYWDFYKSDNYWCRVMTNLLEPQSDEKAMNMPSERYVLWSNIGLDENLDEEAYSYNESKLEDVREKLNVDVGETITIGEVGFFYGLEIGCEVNDGTLLSGCLYASSDCDQVAWFIDPDGEFRSVQIHYNGTHHVAYRKWKDGISEENKTALYEKIEDGTLTKGDIEKYTEKLGTDVVKAMALDFSRREQTKSPRSGGER